MSRLDRFIERFFIAGLVLLVVLVILVVIAPRLAPAPQPVEDGRETLTARVLEVLDEGTIDVGPGTSHPYQRLLLRVEDGSLAGQVITVEEGTINIISQERLFDVGDRVYVERMTGPYGDLFYISDYVRTPPLVMLVVLFMVMIVAVGRGKGARSLVGTLISLGVIFCFIVPQILAGRDPVAVSIAGALVLLAASNYLIYGWNPKTHAAMAGMTVSLLLTGLLAWLFVGWTRLTGLSAEESAYLVMELGPGVQLQGLVLGGTIIGALGVLDDVCIGQASAVFELANANRALRWRDLFRSSLNIGRDHIAAMVNTLLLAYVGASLPLMLVFSIYQEPLWRRINREPIAEEIVRTMVGSIGLVLAVPITGLIASLLAHWMVHKTESRIPRIETNCTNSQEGGKN